MYLRTLYVLGTMLLSNISECPLVRPVVKFEEVGYTQSC